MKEVEVQTTGSLPGPETPGKSLAVKISEMNNASNDHLVGVLCTVIEASIADKDQAKAIKDLVRRELYNSARDRVQLIHSIVGRAEVTKFREWPSLEEQVKQPAPDSYQFSNEI